ncbi:tetratricopeptide repeat protein [Polynucleobacter sp. AP-Capit-er-40B-B4]|uniref:tetratricopeptide repeat protein n=1 Tax=Polynucleobacter sp. AP-Capit-er-40B-B4 TaxID=2576927 RepID=UPI001C0D75CC|nr:tetratricopeptide repeat protein [Polynucleobacter sp. AP-Capit-er-40B-B4]MBU3580437.1 tetratricopeptide repeat protein [Polynucleobacter sp. AP-Capit-er-40B-B4]
MTTALCPQCSELATFSKKRGQFYCSECELAFDLSAAQIEPQTIFLSYAHKSERADDYDISEELVWLIKDELEKDGHNVWIDHEGITAGAQWRERITNAILGHTHFLSFLSKRSVRDPGVCLNEIAIALGSGRQIQTLLTESEEAVRQPLTISHLQWHQFVDWKAIKEGQKTGPKGEAWDAWFSERMALIRENLSDVQHQKVAGDLQRLKEILEPRTFEADIIKSIEGFYGRKWLFEACEQWLNTSSNRLFWLKGSPGVGKSSFAAKLVHQSNSAIVGFFKCEFQGSKSPEESASECIRTLAYQLAARLPDYRTKLLYQQLIDKDKISKKTADDLFTYLITEPLNTSGKIPEATRLALVIDALDEAGRNDGTNALADLIYKHADKLPPWLGIIVTSRPEPYLEQQLGKFESTPIEGGTEQNLQDLRDYLNEQLDPSIEEPQRSAIINQVIEKSGGTFLYLKLIEKDKTLDLAKPETLPTGIDDVFMRDFKRYFPDPKEYGQEAEPFLRLMAVAPGPLPVDLTKDLLSWTSRDITTKVTQPLGSLLQEKNGGLVFFHKSISDWLQDPKRSGLYQVNDTGAKELGNFLWQEFEKGDQSQWQSQVLDWLPAVLPSTECWENLAGLIRFSEFLEDHTKYQAAISIRGRHLAVSEKTSGDNSFEVAHSQFALGLILWRVSRFQDAKNSLLHSKKIQEILGLEKTEMYALTLDEIGFNLKDLVLLDEALLYFQKALEIRNSFDEKNAIDIAGSLNKIAELYDAQGSFTESDKTYRESLRAYADSSLAVSMKTASLLNNYSILQLRMNGGLIFGPENPFTYTNPAFQSAKELLSLALEMAKKTNFSPHHPDNAIIFNNLGIISQNMGDNESASSAFAKSQEFLSQSVGRDHSLYATVLNNEAGLLSCSGIELERANGLLKRAIDIYEKSMGADHPHVARCLNNLGVLSYLSSDYLTASKSYERGLGVYLDTLGESHCDTSQIQCNLGVMLMNEGKHEDARLLFEKACSNRIQSLGVKHPQTGVNYIYLARASYEAQDYLKSVKEYLKGISNLSLWVGMDSKYMLQVLNEYKLSLQKLEPKNFEHYSIDLGVNNEQGSTSSLQPIINRLENKLKNERVVKDEGNLVSTIEELSKSYLRDQLEVLDLGLFDRSVLRVFEITKNLVG